MFLSALMAPVRKLTESDRWAGVVVPKSPNASARSGAQAVRGRCGVRILWQRPHNRLRYERQERHESTLGQRKPPINPHRGLQAH